jgi:hypothetical protein
MAPVEWGFAVAVGSRPIPGSRGTFLVSCHRHHGPDVHLPDGTVVRRGDPIAELHFWNRRIAARHAESFQALTWRLARDIREDLRALARAMARGELARDAVAIFGASPVAAAAHRLGFTVRPVAARWRRALMSAWQLTVRRVFRPAGVPEEIQATTMEAWISRQRLFALYGPDAGDGAPAPRDDRRRSPTATA